MNKHRIGFTIALSVSAIGLIGARPGSTTFEPELAYTLLTGSTELHLTDATGTKSATLYSVRQNIDIDLAPRSQKQIAITENNALKLLTYAADSGGVRTTNIATLYSAGAERITDVDFSPDGSKIAFSQGFTKLMVLDLTQPIGPGNPVQWTQDPVFVGEIAWYKGGAAIAYSDGNNNVIEVAGAGATPTILLHEPTIDMIDASRTDPDALVVTYNGPAQQGPRVGLWKGGGYVNTSLAGSVSSDFGTLNCDDSKLVYGTPDQKGQLIWRIRTLPGGPDVLYTKTLRVRHTQFLPTCAATAQQNGAFDFREVKH